MIRLAQIEFTKRRDSVQAMNVAIGNVSLPMHPANLCPNASGNTLLLDENDEPLLNIINWMDERGSDIAFLGLDLEQVHTHRRLAPGRGIFSFRPLLLVVEKPTGNLSKGRPVLYEHRLAVQSP